MYDDLIKRLRGLASLSAHCENTESCDGCSKEDICLSFTNERIAGAVNEAADTIEELQGREKVLEKVADKWREAVPKWIPIAERLPEKEDMVAFYYAWTGLSGTEYKEITFATLAELKYCGYKPIAWMPLQQPPKEE